MEIDVYSGAIGAYAFINSNPVARAAYEKLESAWKGFEDVAVSVGGGVLVTTVGTGTLTVIAAEKIVMTLADMIKKEQNSPRER